jgi:hypothetical protein
MQILLLSLTSSAEPCHSQISTSPLPSGSGDLSVGLGLSDNISNAHDAGDGAEFTFHLVAALALGLAMTSNGFDLAILADSGEGVAEHDVTPVWCEIIIATNCHNVNTDDNNILLYQGEVRDFTPLNLFRPY